MQWIAIATTAMQVISSISGGNQQAKQFEAYARANEYNAAVLRQRADTTRSAYGQREEQQRRQARFVLGQSRAAAAESGTGLGGSNADIYGQSEIMAEMDALNIRYGGESEAQGYLSQSGLEEWQAGVNRASGSSARRSGFIGAAGALLSGTGRYLQAGGSFPGIGGGRTVGGYNAYGLNGGFGTSRIG